MKKILSVLFAIMMLFSIFFCLPVGAVNSATTDEAMDIIGNTSESDKIRENVFSGEYETGAVIVGLKKDAPPIETLLSGFNITESKLITPGSSGDNSYYVKFAEKTEEIVWKAIAVLEESPYVTGAEPNYFLYVDESTEAEYELGAVIVGLKKDAPPIETLLSGFNITESKLITPGSAGDNIYYVKFAEKTEEIVWKAIAVLEENPYVTGAEPNYFLYVEPPVEESTTEIPTQAVSTAQPTTEIIATTSGNPKSSTSDTPETNNSATSDTVKTVNSNGTVQTGQNNSVMILTLLLIISAAATAVFIKFRYRD